MFWPISALILESWPEIGAVTCRLSTNLLSNTRLLLSRSTEYWLAFCSEHDIPAGPVRSLDDLVDELPIVKHPTSGEYHEIPPPVRFSVTPSNIRRYAPMLGEHGREVLREVGVSEAEIDELIDVSPRLP